MQNPFQDQTFHSTSYLGKFNILPYWRHSYLLSFAIVSSESVCVWLAGQSQSFQNLFLRKRLMNVVFHNSHLGKCFSIPYLHQSAKYPDKTFVNMPVLDAQKPWKEKGISVGKMSKEEFWVIWSRQVLYRVKKSKSQRGKKSTYKLKTSWNRWT